MVIDYAIDVLGIKQKKLSLKTIAESTYSDINSGTPPLCAELVNAILLESVPNIQFKTVSPGTFRDIQTEIDANRPIIAWINILDIGDGIAWHVVVINGYEENKRAIYYLDPLLDEPYAQKSCEIGSFIDIKLGPTGKLIKLVISQEGQKDLFGRVLPPRKRRRRR
jgi:hypothetical protein